LDKAYGEYEQAIQEAPFQNEADRTQKLARLEKLKQERKAYAEERQRAPDLLSMAARARRILSGAFVVEEALKRKQGTYLLLAADASEETKTKFTRMAAQQHVPTAELLTMQQLGHCLGKEYRAVAVLIDRGFADRLSAYLQDIPTGVD